jgi:arabinose-5-phosphate isomerase
LIGITGDAHSTLAQYSDVVLDAGVEREAGSFSIVPTSSSTAALALGDALSIALMQKKGLNEEDFAFMHPKGEIGKKLMKVENLMHRGEHIPCVFQDTSIIDVLEEMSKKSFGMTCVIDKDKKLLGIITDGDLRRMVKKYKGDFFQKTAKDFMTDHPVTIAEGSLATEALNLLEKNKITSLIIQDREKKIIGIVHLHDLWKTEMF